MAAAHLSRSARVTGPHMQVSIMHELRFYILLLGLQQQTCEMPAHIPCALLSRVKSQLVGTCECTPACGRCPSMRQQNRLPGDAMLGLHPCYKPLLVSVAVCELGPRASLMFHGCGRRAGIIPKRCKLEQCIPLPCCSCWVCIHYEYVP